MVEAGNVPKDQAASIMKMKTGDYMIHVFVMIGKNFKNEDDVTINPMIEVTTCGITKYTSAKNDVTCLSSKNESWREHLFFEPRNIHSSAIEIETITIKVKNKGLLKDQLVGMYEFDMARVYSEKRHTIENQWIALFNPESSNFSEITGNLKLSISVQGPGDEQVQLTENAALEDPNQLVMMPAQIKKEYKQLKIRFITAYGLPKMDRFGTIDAYIYTEFMGKKMQTQPQTAKDNRVTIEQEFWLPVQRPMATDRLILQVYDHDAMTAHEIVGSMFFSVKQLIEQGSNGGKFYWQNIYGGPIDYTDKIATEMNNNPELGSTWKGKILMQIESEESKHPERRTQVLDPIIKDTANSKQLFTKNVYDVIAEFGMGICLPLNATKYKIKVQIGDWTMISQDPKEGKEGYNRWSDRIKQQKIMTEYQSIEEMDKIFVYLMEGDKPICYWSGKVTEFTDPNPKFRWLTMKIDKSIAKVEKDYEAGMIQFKLSINDARKNGTIDYNVFDAWKKPPPRRLETRKIRCFIFQCRDIPSADADGSSDAYISFWNPDNKKEVKTRVIEDSLNPIYFETLEMLYDLADIETAPPIVMNIWDRDSGLLSESYDFLGRCTVPLDKAASNLKSLTVDEKVRNNEVPKPTWHDIKMGFDDSLPACGQVLCSFAIVADDFDFETPTKYMRLSDKIPTKEYNLEINILGLRELESCGFMPVKKPYIRFRIKSLLPPEKAQAVTNIDTDPNAPGPNPNINTTLTFSVQLPQEDLYCPSLGCDVFDYVYSGLSQPLIGTMNILIGEIKAEYEAELRETRQNMDEIIATLEKFVSKPRIEMEMHISSCSQVQAGSKPRRNIKEKDDILVKVGRLDGYSQLKDEENQLEEDAPLVMNEDNTAPQAREDIELEELEPEYKDKLRRMKLEQQQIEEKLKLHLEAVVKAGRENKSDVAKKTELKRQLLQARKDFLDQKKLAMSVKKAKDQKQFLQSMGDMAHQMVLCPTYQYNEELKIYTEYNEPPETVFKAVGFNNLEVVKKMMDGDDAEKRSGFQGYQSKNLKTKQDANYDGAFNDPLDSARNSARIKEKQQKQEETDRLLTISNKHYRKFYEDELENNKELFGHDKVFTTVPIYRGQSRGLKKSWLSMFSSNQVDESGQATDKKQVGYFKGRITCFNEEEAQAFKEEKKAKMQRIFNLINQIHKTVYGTPLDVSISELAGSQIQQQRFATKLADMHLLDGDNQLLHFLKEEAYKEIIRKQLLTQTQACIQLYILEGFNFAQRDVGSFSDPYLVVKFGNEAKSTRDNYLLDEPNPKFNKYFEFKGNFPGSSPLVIEVWDYDDLFGDDMIGKTTIDLDDRFFSGDWQALDEKPIEYRDLYHPSTTLSQGVITCWLEIEEQDKKRQEKTQKVWDISPEPEMDYQIRVCVLDTKNVPTEDIEGTSDVFMKVYIDDEDKKNTDTHYRCQNGEASFNYRLLFNVKAPRKKDEYQLVLQAWDFDLFKSNDYICEWVLDLKELVKNVRLTQQPAHLTKKYYLMMLKDKLRDVKLEFMEDDSFWLTTLGKDNKPIKVRLDVRVFPGKLAEKQKLGEGRTEPNMEPHLPPPIGRIQFSLNPLTMLAQLVNKEYLNKLYALLCVIICCACLIAMAPMILSNVVSLIMMKTIGLQ